MFLTAVTRHKQQTSGRLWAANNTTVKCFFQIHTSGKCFISSIMSKCWWHTFHRQHKPPKPPSSPEQGLFSLIFIATIRQIFCLSPLMLMRIWCQFFFIVNTVWTLQLLFRLQPHSPIKPDWSDLWDLNFDCKQFIGFMSWWCNVRSSLRCPCTIDWQFSRAAQFIFPLGAFPPTGNIRTHRVRVETISRGLLCRCSLTPRMSPSRAPILSFAHYFQAPAMQATIYSKIQNPDLNINCFNKSSNEMSTFSFVIFFPLSWAVWNIILWHDYFILAVSTKEGDKGAAICHRPVVQSSSS